MTIIYPSPVFGPVQSRRLGVSLGINLLPDDGKVCTFDCIYCECGLNADHRAHHPMPTREEVHDALEAKLIEMNEEGKLPDVLTFAGNGEPTCHPQFAEIVTDTIALRDKYCQQARISVLSNGTNLNRPEVFAALCRVDNNIQKLDTVSLDYVRRVDRPVRNDFSINKVIENLSTFHCHVIVQTMFLTGTDADGNDVDNTGEMYVAPWLAALNRIQPQRVMIYTIDRETPVSTLRKAGKETLDLIASRVRSLGLDCQVSY